MQRLRISAISYLNTAPLMWDFEHGRPPGDGLQGETYVLPGDAGEVEISYTVPSQCAENLRSGAADVGIIPAFAFATTPNLTILPDVAIAAKGAVRSILLISRKPMEKIATVAADSSSRSSVALLEILFRKFLGGARQLIPMEPGVEAMLRVCDAGLLIGDSALRIQAEGSGHFVYDVAELWKRFTGYPFVFAFWAARREALTEAAGNSGTETAHALARMFRESREHGLEPANVEHVVRQWAPHVGVSEAVAREYITRSIHYYLDEECVAGLKLFYRYAAECGLIPRSPELGAVGQPGSLPVEKAG
ncbi:MAG TPA: menaquinone biosynthesis protein [Terriglobales bacterium]|jgi:chorismate dehydratase|nr:menaquinone biosynthesis protein [Terriglobales bacterium]